MVSRFLSSRYLQPKKQQKPLKTWKLFGCFADDQDFYSQLQKGWQKMNPTIWFILCHASHVNLSFLCKPSSKPAMHRSTCNA